MISENTVRICLLRSSKFRDRGSRTVDVTDNNIPVASITQARRGYNRHAYARGDVMCEVRNAGNTSPSVLYTGTPSKYQTDRDQKGQRQAAKDTDGGRQRYDKHHRPRLHPPRRQPEPTPSPEQRTSLPAPEQKREARPARAAHPRFTDACGGRKGERKGVGEGAALAQLEA